MAEDLGDDPHHIGTDRVSLGSRERLGSPIGIHGPVMPGSITSPWCVRPVVLADLGCKFLRKAA
jgi:hypothetical protein